MSKDILQSVCFMAPVPAQLFQNLAFVMSFIHLIPLPSLFLAAKQFQRMVLSILQTVISRLRRYS